MSQTVPVNPHISVEFLLLFQVVICHLRFNQSPGLSRKWMMRLMDSPSNCSMRKCPKSDTDFCIHLIVLWRTLVKALLVSVINMDSLQFCIVALQWTVSRKNEGHFVICIKVAVSRLLLFRNAFFNHILCANFLYSFLLLCCYPQLLFRCLLTSSVLTFHSHRTDM